MRSGITHRWLRGSLFLTVLLVLLVESMFVYNFSRSYYNSVQQTMMRRFSSINGQLKMYTGDTAQKTAANRSVALRRMVEQFADKDKYEFMLLDGYGGVIVNLPPHRLVFQVIQAPALLLKFLLPYQQAFQEILQFRQVWLLCRFGGEADC